jgi:hypothetical protein
MRTATPFLDAQAFDADEKASVAHLQTGKRLLRTFGDHEAHARVGLVKSEADALLQQWPNATYVYTTPSGKSASSSAELQSLLRAAHTVWRTLEDTKTEFAMDPYDHGTSVLPIDESDPLAVAEARSGRKTQVALLALTFGWSVIRGYLGAMFGLCKSGNKDSVMAMAAGKALCGDKKRGTRCDSEVTARNRIGAFLEVEIGLPDASDIAQAALALVQGNWLEAIMHVVPCYWRFRAGETASVTDQLGPHSMPTATSKYANPLTGSKTTTLADSKPANNKWNKYTGNKLNSRGGGAGLAKGISGFFGLLIPTPGGFIKVGFAGSFSMDTNWDTFPDPIGSESGWGNVKIGVTGCLWINMEFESLGFASLIMMALEALLGGKPEILIMICFGASTNHHLDAYNCTPKLTFTIGMQIELNFGHIQNWVWVGLNIHIPCTLADGQAWYLKDGRMDCDTCEEPRWGFMFSGNLTFKSLYRPSFGKWSKFNGSKQGGTRGCSAGQDKCKEGSGLIGKLQPTITLLKMTKDLGPGVLFATQDHEEIKDGEHCIGFCDGFNTSNCNCANALDVNLNIFAWDGYTYQRDTTLKEYIDRGVFNDVDQNYMGATVLSRPDGCFQWCVFDVEPDYCDVEKPAWDSWSCAYYSTTWRSSTQLSLAVQGGFIQGGTNGAFIPLGATGNGAWASPCQVYLEDISGQVKTASNAPTSGYGAGHPGFGPEGGQSLSEDSADKDWFLLNRCEDTMGWVALLDSTGDYVPRPSKIVIAKTTKAHCMGPEGKGTCWVKLLMNSRVHAGGWTFFTFSVLFDWGSGHWMYDTFEPQDAFQFSRLESARSGVADKLHSHRLAAFGGADTFTRRSNTADGGFVVHNDAGMPYWSKDGQGTEAMWSYVVRGFMSDGEPDYGKFANGRYHKKGEGDGAFAQTVESKGGEYVFKTVVGVLHKTCTVTMHHSSRSVGTSNGSVGVAGGFQARCCFSQSNGLQQFVPTACTSSSGKSQVVSRSPSMTQVWHTVQGWLCMNSGCITIAAVTIFTMDWGRVEIAFVPYNQALNELYDETIPGAYEAFMQYIADTNSLKGNGLSSIYDNVDGRGKYGMLEGDDNNMKGYENQFIGEQRTEFKRGTDENGENSEDARQWSSEAQGGHNAAEGYYNGLRGRRSLNNMGQFLPGGGRETWKFTMVAFNKYQEQEVKSYYDLYTEMWSDVEAEVALKHGVESVAVVGRSMYWPPDHQAQDLDELEKNWSNELAEFERVTYPVTIEVAGQVVDDGFVYIEEGYIAGNGDTHLWDGRGTGEESISCSFDCHVAQSEKDLMTDALVDIGYTPPGGDGEYTLDQRLTSPDTDNNVLLRRSLNFYGGRPPLDYVNGNFGGMADGGRGDWFAGNIKEYHNDNGFDKRRDGDWVGDQDRDWGDKIPGFGDDNDGGTGPVRQPQPDSDYNPFQPPGDDNSGAPVRYDPESAAPGYGQPPGSENPPDEACQINDHDCPLAWENMDAVEKVAYVIFDYLMDCDAVENDADQYCERECDETGLDETLHPLCEAMCKIYNYFCSCGVTCVRTASGQGPANGKRSLNSWSPATINEPACIKSSRTCPRWNYFATHVNSLGVITGVVFNSSFYTLMNQARVAFFDNILSSTREIVYTDHIAYTNNGEAVYVGHGRNNPSSEMVLCHSMAPCTATSNQPISDAANEMNWKKFDTDFCYYTGHNSSFTRMWAFYGIYAAFEFEAANQQGFWPPLDLQQHTGKNTKVSKKALWHRATTCATSQQDSSGRCANGSWQNTLDGIGGNRSGDKRYSNFCQHIATESGPLYINSGAGTEADGSNDEGTRDPRDKSSSYTGV